MRLALRLVLAVAIIAGLVYAGQRLAFRRNWQDPRWRRATDPGPLSHAHAFLQGKCESCHAPGRGIDSRLCTACHATAGALLSRQPTVFHATITDCRTCHAEHLGRERRPTVMDHAALAQVGAGRPRSAAPRRQRIGASLRDQILSPRSVTNPRLSETEGRLDCVSCHQVQDRHRGFFGKDCAECHGTSTWTVAGFLHPSPRSRNCAECHQAPPSHFMEHFEMISRVVARQPAAKERECFLCHRTTSWNDIPGVGWYKHH